MEWYEYLVLVIGAALLGGLAWLIVWSVQSEHAANVQEQRFANEFSTQCTQAGGIVSVGDNYVCYKNNTILFQTGIPTYHSAK